MARNNYLKFDTAVRDYYGSNNTAIAFGRLLYWSRKQPKGFYKFKQPCKKHPLYKKGDSWGEELGMSRKVLDPIMDRLVNRHLTKRSYIRCADKFNGKMFASYTNHKTNQTYYFMDAEAVEAFLSSLSPTKVEAPLPSPACDAPEGVDALPVEAKNMPQIPPSDVPVAPPFAHSHQTAINTQTITSLSGDVQPEVMEVGGEEEKLSSKKMVELWNSHTQDKVRWYPSTAGRLCKVLADFFGGCLEAFRKYCAAIGNTPFLMGKAPNSKFKAFFYWAIKPETIKDIFGGAYGVECILSKIGIGNNPEAKKLEEEHDFINSEIQKVNYEIQYLKNQVIESQKKSIQEYQEAISQQVRDNLLKPIEADVIKTYPDWSEQQRGWVVGFRLEDALKAYSRSQLNLCDPGDIVVPQHLLDEKKRLEDKRIVICERLQEISKQSHDGISMSIVSAPQVEPVTTEPQASRAGKYKVLKDYDNSAIASLFQKPDKKLQWMKSPPKYINPNDRDVEAKKAEFLQAFGLPSNYSPKLYGGRA